MLIGGKLFKGSADAGHRSCASAEGCNCYEFAQFTMTALRGDMADDYIGFHSIGFSATG